MFNLKLWESSLGLFGLLVGFLPHTIMPMASTPWRSISDTNLVATSQASSGSSGFQSMRLRVLPRFSRLFSVSALK